MINHHAESSWFIMIIIMIHRDGSLWFIMTIETIWGPSWDRFGIIWGPSWDHCWIILGSFCDHLGIILGPPWNHIGTISRPSWDNVGITFGPSGEHVGTILGPLWYRKHMNTENTKWIKHVRTFHQKTSNKYDNSQAPCAAGQAYAYGGLWEASGSYLEGIWDASGAVWEASGSWMVLGNTLYQNRSCFCRRGWQKWPLYHRVCSLLTKLISDRGLALTF